MMTVSNKTTGCGMLIGLMISKLQISNSTVFTSSSPLDIPLASCYQNLVAATATRRTKDPLLARVLPFFLRGTQICSGVAADLLSFSNSRSILHAQDFVVSSVQPPCGSSSLQHDALLRNMGKLCLHQLSGH